MLSVIMLGCGGNFHGTTGSIQTPNYPRNYDANAECVWSILSDDSMHINLDFDPNYGLGTGDTIEVRGISKHSLLKNED